MAETVDSLVTCKPDHLALGMTAVAFLGGPEGEKRLRSEIEDRSGLDVTTGPSAMAAALEAYGAERVAVISPYQPYGEQEVHGFFSASGYEVVRTVSLRSPNATSIAEVDATRLREIIREIDAPEVEAIVQVGTNLVMARLADEMEKLLGKPVLAINTATLWRVLRSDGVKDQLRGYGSLLEKY
jgi:maleate isomerase